MKIKAINKKNTEINLLSQLKNIINKSYKAYRFEMTIKFSKISLNIKFY